VVELLGASENPSANRPWWRPDGSPLAERPYDQPLGAKSFPQKNQLAREFAVRLTNLPADDVDAQWQFDPSSGSCGTSSPLYLNGREVKDVRAESVTLPADKPTVNIRIGVAAGAWRTVATDADLTNSSGSAVDIGQTDGSVIFAPVAEKDGGFVATVATELPAVSLRFIAVGVDGREITATETGGSGVGRLTQYTAVFSHVAVKDIKWIELQTRNYQWAQFKNVAASPGAITQANVASHLRGRVLSADGRPVNGATVFVALPGPSDIRIRNGEIEDGNPTRFVTGADGTFDLPPQSGKFVLAALADEGYGQIDQDDVGTSCDIYLTPWGRIRGRVMVGTKPVADAHLQAETLDLYKSQGPVRISIVNRAVTEADGSFIMNRVIPGMVLVERTVEESRRGTNVTTFFAGVGGVQVPSGKTALIQFGGVGRPIVGRFIFPPGKNPSDYDIHAQAIQVLNGRPGPRQYTLHLDEHQNFRVDDVLPGDYRIHILLLGDRTGPPEQPAFTMPEIPGGVSDDPLVIGDIQLQFPATAGAGADAAIARDELTAAQDRLTYAQAQLDHGNGTPLEVLKAKYDRDIAAARVNGDLATIPVLQYERADAIYKFDEQQFNVGLLTNLDLINARNDRAVAAVAASVTVFQMVARLMAMPSAAEDPQGRMNAARRQLVRDIGALGDVAIPVLEANLSEAKTELQRSELAQALANARTPTGTEALLALASDPDDDVRSAAILGIAGRINTPAEEGGSERILAVLAKLVPGEKLVSNRRIICYAMRMELVSPLSTERHDDQLLAMNALRDRLKNDSSELIRVDAACILTEFGDFSGREEIKRFVINLAASGDDGPLNELVPAIERISARHSALSL
jgi:hypothetical protein